MFLTPSGIVTLLITLQPENAELLIHNVPSDITRLVTELKGIVHCHPGTVASVTFVQPENA
jgi:hypothetical protein